MTHHLLLLALGVEGPRDGQEEEKMRKTMGRDSGSDELAKGMVRTEDGNSRVPTRPLTCITRANFYTSCMLTHGPRELGHRQTEFIFVSQEPGSATPIACDGPGSTDCAGIQTHGRCIPRARSGQMHPTNHTLKKRNISLFCIKYIMVMEHFTLILSE